MLTALPPIFAGLPEEDSRVAAAMFTEIEVAPGAAIMIQGEEDTTLAFLVKGSAEIWKDDVKVGKAGSRDMLGEVELFGQMPRVCSVTAANQVTLQVLEPEAFRTLCEQGNRIVYALERAVIRRLAMRVRTLDEGITERTEGIPFELHPQGKGLMSRIAGAFARKPKTPDLDPVEVLRGSQLFSWAPEPILADIASHFEVEHFDAEQILCRQGEEGDRMYILASGEVEVVLLLGTDHAHSVATLRAGQAFGDGAVALNAPRSATCVSRGEVVVLTMQRQKFIELHDSDEAGGSAFRQGIINNLIVQFLATLDRFVAIETRNQAQGRFTDAGTPVSNVWR